VADSPVVEHLELATDEHVGNLSGRVTSTQQRPISRATVKLLCDEKVCEQTFIDANGEFIFFSLSPRDDYTIRLRRHVQADNHGVPLTFQAPADLVSVSRARPAPSGMLPPDRDSAPSNVPSFVPDEAPAFRTDAASRQGTRKRRPNRVRH
jgi:hypothetical protein